MILSLFHSSVQGHRIHGRLIMLSFLRQKKKKVIPSEQAQSHQTLPAITPFVVILHLSLLPGLVASHCSLFLQHPICTESLPNPSNIFSFPYYIQRTSFLFTHNYKMTYPALHYDLCISLCNQTVSQQRERTMVYSSSLFVF